MMNAARLHAAHDLRLHRESVPEPRPGESLIRVTSVGICGSDLHWYEDGMIGGTTLDQPLVLGHEFAAVIEQGPKAGQRVTVDPAVPCTTCHHCLHGHPNLCQHQHFSGHREIDGALREYMAWPDHCLIPIPDTLTHADSAMLEPLGVAVHAVDLGHVQPGDTVGVFGCGPIGLLVMQVARVAGATRIIATDPLPHRLEAAQRFGATHVVQAPQDDEHDLIRDLTQGRGVDVAFEAAGEQAAVDAAVETARPGARIVLIGISADDRLSFKASTVRRKGLTLKLQRRMGHVYPRAIALVEQNRVNVRDLVSHHFPLTAVEDAFTVAHERTGLKVVVEP